VVKAGTPCACVRRQPGQPRLPGPATSTGISRNRAVDAWPHFTPWPAPWQRKPGSLDLGASSNWASIRLALHQPPPAWAAPARTIRWLKNASTT